MRSKAIIKEKSSRRRIIITIVLIIAGLSLFYNYQSILVNQRFKNQLIDIKVNEFRQNLNHFYSRSVDDYLKNFQIISESPKILQSIKEKDSSSFFHSFALASKTEQSFSSDNIQVFSPEGIRVFGDTSKSGIELVLRSFADNLHTDSADQKVKLCSNGLYHIVKSPIKEGENGFIEIGVLDKKGIKALERINGVMFFTLINTDIVNKLPSKSITTSVYNQDYSLISFEKSDFLNEFTINKVFDKPIIGEKSTVKISNKYYSLVKTGEFVKGNNELAGIIIAAVDITNLEAPFYNFLIRSILLTLIIVVLSYLLIRIFFDQLIERFFKIEESFEREVAERTKKILDTNVELHQIFNSTGNGMRIINKNYDIIRVNDSFCKISGTTNDSIEGSKCYDIFPGIFCHTSNCPLDRIREGESSIETEEVRFKKGGKKIRCQHTAVPFLGNNGEFLGIIEDFKDITEKCEVENTLKRTEEQFSTFMDSLPVGVFIKDYNGILLYQNSHLKNIFGLDNLIGKNLSKELKPDWGERILLEDEKVLQHGRIELEETLTDKEGHDRTFVTHKFRFPGIDNNWKIGGISIDITKKKITEHFLYVLSKAIKNSPVSIVITNPTGNIEFINPSFTQLTGYSLTDAIHRNLLEMKVEYNSGKNLIQAIESVKRGEVWKGEIHLQNKEGEHFWVLASFAPIFNRKSEVSHCVASMEDITLRKEYERELLLSKTKAEESDKLKTAFLSNLSHEIRTPLNAIIGFSSLLTDSDLTISEKRNLSDVLYKNSNDLLKLIENLIEISEIETGQLSIKKCECNVNKLIEDIKTSFLLDDKKGKSVKLNVRREIGSDDFTILTDSLRLKQVLNNLISNAAKFTDNGFIEFGYTFKDERTLMFYVIDTGIGIEPEKQKYIFNPFRQADDSNTRRFGGMGLGLAISRHIVEKLGGKIWLTSIPGSGSTFYFTIPYIPVRFKFDPEPKEVIKTTYDWKNKTILVADDIDSNYVFLKTVIKQTNAEVLWAKSGLEAIELVKKNPSIDLVLMDIVMPDMDGFEATKLIKRHNINLPIVCQTAYPTNENYNAANGCGFDGFMAKPIKVEGMLQVIDKFFPKN
ncbi:MAG: PAS domain S-box protein [Bacteroidales bacterium]|nr:MAG: PAS domain S-box protein [Bacteroidales bacterium]